MGSCAKVWFQLSRLIFHHPGCTWTVWLNIRRHLLTDNKFKKKKIYPIKSYEAKLGLKSAVVEEGIGVEV